MSPYLPLICLAGVALASWRLLKRKGAETLYPPSGSFLDVAGCRLHFTRQRQGQSVVLLHGSGGFLQDFEGVCREAGGKFDLIAFDRPGHGYSTALAKQSGSLSEQARVLHSALQQMGVERPLLVGHSWSAGLCLFYALEYPQEVCGLVLLSPWVSPEADRPPFLIYAARFVGKTLSYVLLKLTPLKRLLLSSSLRQAFFPDAVPRAYQREALALWQRLPAQVGVFLEENTDGWNRLQALSTRFAEVEVPVSILIGECDKMLHAEVHAQALHRELPYSELRVVPQTGHEIPQLRPALVVEAITRCHANAAVQTADSLPKKNAFVPRQHARELILRYGWNATAYQILNPDILLWFTPDRTAVVGYVRHFKVRVAAGAPVCEASCLAEVVAAFEQDAAENGERVCWFAATTRLQNALAGTASHDTLVIGAQPVWNPMHWADILRANGSLRAQLNRARNKGVGVSEWSQERASGNPDLQRCLDEWLAHHLLPTLHFLTEPVTLDRLTDRRIFVAEEQGIPLGFLIATPVPSRNGWLIEQFVRGSHAPNGTMELLVDGVMQTLAKEGGEYLTLGLAPLTQRAHIPSRPMRFWLRVTLAWARMHGQRFYNFEGLDAFKAKFKPEYWEPLFALSNEPRVSLRTLIAVAAAFSDASLLGTVARALGSAVRQEARWLKDRAKRKPPRDKKGNVRGET